MPRLEAAKTLTAGRDRDWLLDDLRPIGVREALRRNPEYVRRVIDEVPGAVFHECRHFDPDTGLCGDHEDRPATCGGFPWYGREPSVRRVLPACCTFRADQGLPVEPVAVEFTRRAGA